MNSRFFQLKTKWSLRVVTLCMCGWLLAGYFGGMPASAQAVSPFMGLGIAQFFDNNGKPLTAGVLYSYQAGTSTQQATFTDSTGTIQNVNPIPFGSGARGAIWLTSGALYKFVLCSQNDGAFCSPGDVLFSVDQVPGSPGFTSGGSTFTGTFISGSASPATTGILRLATGDGMCWRNQAGTANLCIRKDTNDVLSWDGPAVKFPEGSCTLSAIGYDYLCADAATHRWNMFNNGGGEVQVVASGVDINTSDQVTQLHFGATATPLSTTPPTTGQFMKWNGTQWVGATPTFTAPPSVVSYVQKLLGGNVSVPSATLTTLTSQNVTMPSSGCPCRASVSYGVRWTNSNAGVVNVNVNDGTNTFASSELGVAGSFSNGTGLTASAYSTGTYANNAVVSFGLRMEQDTGATVTVQQNPHLIGQGTWMGIAVFTSN